MAPTFGWILGIDPGATTGWVVYAVDSKAVIDQGEFPGADCSQEMLTYLENCGYVVLERPRGQGPTRPQVVECGIVFGMLYQRALMHPGTRHDLEVTWLYRLDVCKRLTAALHGTISVRNDSTAWAALVALHGDRSDFRGRKKKGAYIEQPGPIGICTGHARAALATAVALTYPAP